MKNDTYAHAPRLPDLAVIDPRTVFVGAASDASSGPLDPRPVELEIGPGRGWFTVERLEFDAEVRVVGLEIRRKWATIVDERLKKRGYGGRGRIFAEDAKLVLPKFLSASVSVAYLHFPDPWWKKRHEKRLVLGDDVVRELARVIVPGGEFFIQTDVFERADEYEAAVLRCPSFVPFAGTSPRVEDHPYGARSPRERKAIEHGLPVARLRYRCLGPLGAAPVASAPT